MAENSNFFNNRNCRYKFIWFERINIKLKLRTINGDYKMCQKFNNKLKMLTHYIVIKHIILRKLENYYFNIIKI